MSDDEIWSPIPSRDEVRHAEGELLSTTLEQIHSSSLMVNVDYLDLVDRVGDEEAWIVLGKLKDLLG